jgi:hypothetical protein
MLDEASAPYIDTSADNQVSPLDALLVINYLNRFRDAGEGEALIESLMTPAQPFAPIAPANDDYFRFLDREAEDGTPSENNSNANYRHLADWRDATKHRSVSFRVDPTQTLPNRIKTPKKVDWVDAKLSDQGPGRAW